jgi:hypothetical protein
MASDDPYRRNANDRGANQASAAEHCAPNPDPWLTGGLGRIHLDCNEVVAACRTLIKVVGGRG